MAESTLSMSFLDLQRQVRRYLGLTTPYATGTIGIAAGVVTLTGGVFPADAAACDLFVNGSIYSIASRDGNTQVTLDDTSVAVTAGASYILGDSLQTSTDVIHQGWRSFLTAHQWSFLRPWVNPPLTLSAPYTTGAIGIAAGVVTLSGGTFPSWDADEMELVANGETYTVASRDSTTQLTLDDTDVTLTAGASYSLIRPHYFLPDDFGELLGKVHFRKDSTVWRSPIPVVGQHEIVMKRWADDFDYTARPQLCALTPRPFATGSASTRYRLSFWPVPDDAYKVLYQYMVRLDAPTSPSDYPPGSMEHAGTILAACLCEAERTMEDAEGVQESQYMKRLQASIQQDQRTGTAEYLGQNLDHSDRPHDNLVARRDGYMVTYEGYDLT